jgi:hypothetical protein
MLSARFDQGELARAVLRLSGCGRARRAARAVRDAPLDRPGQSD